MIAIFDPSENKVVVIGDRIYRLSYDEFLSTKSLLESKGIVYLNSDFPNSRGLVSLSGKERELESIKDRNINERKTEEHKHVGSLNGRSIVVNGLEPKLQFVGADDIKSIDNLVMIYGSMPEEVNALIKKGNLILMSDSEKNERLKKANEKKAIKGKKVSQSSSKSARLAESYSESDDQQEDTLDPDIDESEGRVKNAVKIDL